jgi:hypothetical protein
VVVLSRRLGWALLAALLLGCAPVPDLHFEAPDGGDRDAAPDADARQAECAMCASCGGELCCAKENHVICQSLSKPCH